MKKITLSIASISCAVLLFSACNKDDNNNNGNGNSSILGKWEFASIETVIRDSSTVPPTVQTLNNSYTPGESVIIEFKGDNTFNSVDYSTTPSETENGTYFLSGNNIELISSENDTARGQYAISNNIMKLTTNESEPGFSGTATITLNRK